MAQSVPSSFNRLQSELEAELKRSIGERNPPLHDMLRYHMGWVEERGMPPGRPPGERVLGTLCLLAAEAAGCPYTHALPAAVAVELLCAFSQIHEDVRRGSPARSNRPAVWWTWGHSQGINAGDGMYALARLATMELDGRDLPADVVQRSVVALDRCCLELCEQQFLEIDLKTGSDQSVQEYLRIIEGTSGALMGCALELGALVGGSQEHAVDVLRLFGRKAGVAYHVRQEIDALWSGAVRDPFQVLDMLDKGRSLPVLYALAAAEGGELETLEAISERRKMIEAQDIDELLTLFERVGARSYARDASESHLSEAIAALHRSGIDSPAVRELEGVARYLAQPEE